MIVDNLRCKFIQGVVSMVIVHSTDFSIEDICMQKAFSTLFYFFYFILSVFLEQ